MDRPSTSTGPVIDSQTPVTTSFRSSARQLHRPLAVTIPIPEEPVQPSFSFNHLLRNFCLVPTLSVLEFVVTAIALLVVPHPHSRKPNILAILVALSFWSISHHLGPPLFRLFDLLTVCLPPNEWSEYVVEGFSTLIHTAIKELARYTAVFVLHQIGHPTLIDVLWLAFGWALGDVTCGIYQNYLNLYQYKEGPLPGADDNLSAAPWSGYRAGEIITSASTDTPQGLSLTEGVSDDHYEALLDVELSRLAALKARLELEDIYGIPFPDIPPIIVSIQWLDSLLLSFGLTLIMSHPFIAHGTIAATIPVVALTWAVHSCLALGYALAMPKIGVHVVNYFGLMVSIGVLVGGLAEWDVLD